MKAITFLLHFSVIMLNTEAMLTSPVSAGVLLLEIILHVLNHTKENSIRNSPLTPRRLHKKLLKVCGILHYTDWFIRDQSTSGHEWNAMMIICTEVSFPIASMLTILWTLLSLCGSGFVFSIGVYSNLSLSLISRGAACFQHQHLQVYSGLLILTWASSAALTELISPVLHTRLWHGNQIICKAYEITCDN